MADTSPYPNGGDDTGAAADRESTTGTPRWVKVSGVVALAVVVLFVVVMLVLGGEHGPGRHTGGSDTTAHTPGGHTGPPAGFDHDDRQP